MPAGPAMVLHQPCGTGSVGDGIDGTIGGGVGSDRLSPVTPKSGKI